MGGIVTDAVQPSLSNPRQSFIAVRFHFKKWFQAIHIISKSNGISSSKLSREIDLNQRSAWYIAKRIRSGIVSGVKLLREIISDLKSMGAD